MTISQPAALARQSQAGDTPASLAAAFRLAAVLIREHDYNPSATSANRPEDGYSGSSAIEAAASIPHSHPADQAAAAEEALTRFAGFLYLTGLATRRTSVYDITDTTAGQWEACRPGRGWRTRGEVLAALEAAAAMLDSPRRLTPDGIQAGAL